MSLLVLSSKWWWKMGGRPNSDFREGNTASMSVPNDGAPLESQPLQLADFIPFCRSRNREAARHVVVRTSAWG